MSNIGVFNVRGDERLRGGNNLQIIGEILEICKECVLLEKHEILQLHKGEGFMPTDVKSYLHPNFEKPYVVIYFNENGNDALFFDDLDTAYEYYRNKKPLTGFDLDKD